jgi:hypothetical protein
MVRNYRLFLVVTGIKCLSDERRASRQKNPPLQLYVRTPFASVTTFFLSQSTSTHSEQPVIYYIAQKCKNSVNQVDRATKFCTVGTNICGTSRTL